MEERSNRCLSRWKRLLKRRGSKVLAWILVVSLFTPLLCIRLTYAADTPEGGLCPHHALDRKSVV